MTFFIITCSHRTVIYSSKCPWIFFCKSMENLPVISPGTTSCIFKNCYPPCNFSHFSSHDFCNCSLSFRKMSCQNPIAHFKFTLELSPRSNELFGLSFLFKGFMHYIPHPFFPPILWTSVCYVILQWQKMLMLCLLTPEASINFEIFLQANPAGNICNS